MGIAWGGVLQGVNQGAQLGMQITEAERRRAREDKMAAREDQAYQEQQDLKANTRTALQDVAPVQGEAMVNPNPAVDPSKYEDTSVYNSDVRELRRGGTLAETRPATWVGNTEVKPDQAAFAAGVQNSQAGHLEKLSKAYAQAGQVDQALKMRQLADEARSEGADKFIDDAFARAPGMDALAKGPVRVPIDMNSREAFAATGKLKLPPDAELEYFRNEAPNGAGAFIDARVVDKAGRPVHAGSLKQYQWVMATNPIQRQQVDRVGLLEKVAREDKVADNLRGDRQLDILEKHYGTVSAAQAAQHQQVNDFRDREISLREQAERAKQASLEARLSPAHKAALGSMDKQQANLEDQVKSTQDALIKGITGGTFQETDENGKPTKEAAAIQRTLRNLETQIGSIAMRRADIMKQYESGAVATKDPVGLRKKPEDQAGPSNGREVVSKAEQAKRDADAVPILQETHAKNLQSLANAKTPEERGRAEYDVEASARELKERGVAPAGTLKSAAPAAPAASAPAPSPSPAPAPAAAPAPAPKAEAAKPPASSLESWAKTQKAAEQSRRDDPELKRLQAAVDNASGRQIHAAKKALEDYRRSGHDSTVLGVQ